MSDCDQQAVDALWYHAATLRERLVSFSTSRANSPLPTEEQIQRGTHRLAQWKSQKAFQDPALFTERLAMDSITEQDRLKLLSEPIEQVQQRIATSTGIPTWLELLHALVDPATVLKLFQNNLVLRLHIAAQLPFFRRR